MPLSPFALAAVAAALSVDDVAVVVAPSFAGPPGACAWVADVPQPFVVDEGWEERWTARPAVGAALDVVDGHVRRRVVVAHAGAPAWPGGPDLRSVRVEGAACPGRDDEVVGGTRYLLAIPPRADDGEVARVSTRTLRGRDGDAHRAAIARAHGVATAGGDVEVATVRLPGRALELAWVRVRDDESALSVGVLRDERERWVPIHHVLEVVGGVLLHDGTAALVLLRGGGKYSGQVTLSRVAAGEPVLVDVRVLATYGC